MTRRTETVTVDRDVIACDICSREARDDERSYMRICRVCDRDICSDCSGILYLMDIDLTDYLIYDMTVCPECEKTVDIFGERIKGAEEVYEEVKDKIFAAWKAASLNGVKDEENPTSGSSPT